MSRTLLNNLVIFIYVNPWKLFNYSKQFKIMFRKRPLLIAETF